MSPRHPRRRRNGFNVERDEPLGGQHGNGGSPMTLRDWLAVGWLILLASTPFAVAWRNWRRTRYTAFQYFLFCLTYFIVRLQWRASLPPTPPAPPGQGAVLIANHRSSVDPFFIQMTMSHPSHWMVAREYCVSRAFGWFLRQCEVIPTGRGGVDTASTKSAIRLAAQGELVGLFPEGRINQSSEFLLPLRAGAILVALKAKVPVIPCYLHGSPFCGPVWSPFTMMARTRVLYGQPIDLSDYYERRSEEGVLGELMCRCAMELAKLAERADYQPKLAGRRWNSEHRADAGPADSEPAEPPSQTPAS